MPFIQLDNYLLHPALSGLFSFTFILGIFHINHILNRLLKFKDDFLLKICSFYTLFGFISSLTVFVSLLNLVNNYFIIFFYYFICVLGLISTINFLFHARFNSYFHHKIIFIKNTHYSVFYLTLTVLAFYFLLSITPATDADSLDYHLGLPLDILRKDGLYFKLEWKHSRIVGLGEFINLIGLIIRTDNIGSSLNFVSLCLLLFVTYNYTTKKQINILLTLVILSTPLLLQLIPSQKPQFYGVCSIVIPTILILKTGKINQKYLFVIIGSVFFGISLKYSFYISGCISLLFIIYVMKHRLPINIIYCIILYLTFIFPLHFLKYNFFGDPISPMLSMFLNNGPVEQQFYSEFKIGTDGFGMPLGLFIPATAGNLSTVAGVGILTLFGINKISHQSRKYFIFALILFIFILILGQNVSRSFFEALIIFYIAIFVSIDLKSSRLDLVSLIIYFQLLFIFLATLTGVYTLSPSLFSNKYRKNIMKNTAHNYSVMSWVNDEIPKDSCIISDFRSNALIPREFVVQNYSVLLFYDLSKKIIFKNCNDYKYIFLITDTQISKSHSLYKYVILPEFSKNKFINEYRNPLKTNTYLGYIYMVNKRMLFNDDTLKKSG